MPRNPRQESPSEEVNDGTLALVRGWLVTWMTDLTDMPKDQEFIVWYKGTWNRARFLKRYGKWFLHDTYGGGCLFTSRSKDIKAYALVAPFVEEVASR